MSDPLEHTFQTCGIATGYGPCVLAEGHHHVHHPGHIKDRDNCPGCEMEGEWADGRRTERHRVLDLIDDKLDAYSPGQPTAVYTALAELRNEVST